MKSDFNSFDGTPLSFNRYCYSTRHICILDKMLPEGNEEVFIKRVLDRKMRLLFLKIARLSFIDRHFY